ncbi:MAG: RagB/SusD family nutrient uptake outer membrane protein [Chitinophagaceae bacterium]|nr:RagB/SusD family nutrient uptake outer membrane protein [Chitinophagaceae bacterium]MBL0130986.1 RagB/SusD family nutrient uptake outer membrane protein [Chitinophagaceae bacterium]MBL0272708.1 RagB/SusD family nutrient uptake outer membrane protein [Chitinophagaceae bacterium]
MKRFYSNLLILTIVALSTVSCKKFLDRPPEGQLGETEAFKTEADVKAFANGIYTLFANNEFYSGRHQVLNELLGDHYKGDRFTGDYSEIFKRQNSFFGGTRDAYYQLAYRIITDANLVIKHLDLATISKNQLEGEAKLFRAMAHFELVRMFAQPWGYSADNSHLGVPIRTTVGLEPIQRSTVKEVYDQIITDLLSAETLLQDVTPTGKFYTATKWAAKAYLARVYFQQNDFAKAFQSANEVITSNKFNMDASFASRFSLGLSTEGILTIANQTSPIQYSPGGDLRGNFRSDLGIPGFTFTDQFYNVATARAADLRKAWYSNTLQSGYNVLTKYNKNFFDLPLIHLTEIKLIRAEAGAETGGANLAVAIADINQVMTRAYGGTSYNLPAIATAAAVIAATRNERELELVGEGNRTQEIKRIGARNGTNVDRRNSVWNCNGFILQFPKAEKDANTSFIMNIEGGCF